MGVLGVLVGVGVPAGLGVPIKTGVPPRAQFCSQALFPLFPWMWGVPNPGGTKAPERTEPPAPLRPRRAALHHHQLGALPLAQRLTPSCHCHRHCPRSCHCHRPPATVLPPPLSLAQSHGSSHQPSSCHLWGVPSCVSPQIPTVPVAPTPAILNKAALSSLSRVSVPRLP